MKKSILFISVMLFASINDKYLDFTNKLVTYNFELKNIDKISSPFFKVKKLTFIKKNNIKNVKHFIHISLLSIFNDLAYIKVEEFKGDKLIKKYTKWVKKGDKIEQCKVDNVKIDKIILKCNNKILVKKLNKKLLNIKVEK
jgi:hypothetical protein